VIAEGEGYFVAHDSDPQNLHATGLAFKEVDRVLSDQIRAKQIVLLADACHAGSIGWTGDPSSPSRAAGVLESIGRGDRSILKLLASRSNEQSFEDGRWDGGHGVFTFALLRGLRGGADRDKDGNIRVAEIIEHISQVVPRETGSRQNPRVAGNFEPQLSLATFRDAGFVGPLPANLATTSAALAKLESLIRSGRVTGSGGAVEWYRSQRFDREEKPVADTILTSALEETGQACVNDYVQSTVMGLKRNMLRSAEEAYRELRALRPGDPTLVTKEGFCRARAEIAEAKYEQAATTLRGVLRLDPQFACAHNALGVALDRIGKREEAIASWERAAQLTPEWSLPFLQIAQQKISESRLEDALPWLEKAARYNPRSMAAQWNLLRAYRLLNRDAEFEKQSGVLIAANPNYAPAYLEIAQYFELKKEGARAADAYDMYAQLAPNFADTNQVRARSAQLRSQANRKVPSLKK
jgi:Flp pilus assembly protein TadD